MFFWKQTLESINQASYFFVSFEDTKKYCTRTKSIYLFFLEDKSWLGMLTYKRKKKNEKNSKFLKKTFCKRFKICMFFFNFNIDFSMLDLLSRRENHQKFFLELFHQMHWVVQNGVTFLWDMTILTTPSVRMDLCTELEEIMVCGVIWLKWI